MPSLERGEAASAPAFPPDVAASQPAALGALSVAAERSQGAPACLHCGLPCEAPEAAPPPAGGSEGPFCCHGCRVVYSMLHQHDLTAYYRYRDPRPAPPAATTGRGYAELDDPGFLSESSRALEGGHRSMDLLLEGVHCAACVWLVEKLPEVVPGVTRARLDYPRRRLTVDWRPDAVSPSTFGAALDRLGYPPHPHCAGKREELLAREERDLLLRMGVAGACAGNVMLFGLALYSGAFSGMAESHSSYFRGASALIALPAVLWSARPLYRKALAAVRARAPHLDIPVSLGIGLATLSGVVNVVRGRGDVYFDSVTALIFLLLGGRYLQLRQQRNAEERAGVARALTPKSARVVDDSGHVRVVAASSVAVGALVEVLPGDTFPVDGHLREGRSRVDAAWLTGEPEPVAVAPGDPVLAGTVNVSGRVRVQATRSGSQTRAAQLLEEVERAALRRAPIARLADRVAGWFLVAVVAGALLAFAVWLPAGLDRAVETAVSLLIVTCPCALGLATPLALSAALAQAARAGWLIKGGELVEALARPALIVFDKTGTLTSGRSRVVRWVGDPELKAAVVALERDATHPTGRALARDLTPQPHLEARDVQTRPGLGVQGLVGGQRVGVGSVAMLGEQAPGWARREAARIEAEGLSPVLVAVDGEVRALAAVGDALRPRAARTLQRLAAAGHRLAVLSGDRQAVVDHVVASLSGEGAEPLFVSALGGQSPEDKLAWVEAARGRGPVFMVGDGVNDAAALAAATVGIAVHGGAQASISAAGVFASREGIAPVFELLAGARAALRVIRLNFTFSLLYNAVAVALTLTGRISPLLAAVLMPISSLTVILHSYQRRMFDPAPPASELRS